MEIYSLGGKDCVDAIMQFPGCLILIVSLLKSESSAASEAAAGLLTEISVISLYYRDNVAGLLIRGEADSVAHVCLNIEDCFFFSFSISYV